jgi:hypothetical protein
MKQILFSLVLLISSFASAQDSVRVDRIVMVTGEIKEGSVKAISENTISFVHAGETLEYSLKKENIGKIEFSSGRIEQFNKIEKPEESKSEMIDHHNRIAILPVIYVRDGKQVNGDVMEEKAQQKLFEVMNDHVGYMIVQEPTQTNVSLKKSGITLQELSGYTIPEIAHDLGVEYVVKTVLNIEEKGVKTYNSSSGNVSSNSRGIHSYSSSSSTSTIQYQTTIDMMVYNDHGEQIYSKSKISFFQTTDAYPLTLKYLTKRMPFYTK